MALTYVTSGDLVTIDLRAFSEGGITVDLGVPQIVGQFTLGSWGTDRNRAYTGPRTEVLAALEADGFATSSRLYRAIDALLTAPTAPARVQVGRRDPDDATITESLTAIWEAGGTGYVWEIVDALTDDEAVEAATWAATKPLWISFETEPGTASADAVYQQAAGNLAERLADLVPLVADGLPRWALTWHDPPVASRAAAPFYQIAAPGGAAGTWDLRPPGSPLGGSVTVNLWVDAEAEQIATITGAVAEVEGTAPAPWVLENGWHLDWRIDAGAIRVLTIEAEPGEKLTTGAWPRNLSAVVGDDLEVFTDTGTDSYAFLTAAAPADPAAVTAAEVVADFNAGISGTVATAELVGGQVRFRSVTEGTAAWFRLGDATTTDLRVALSSPDGIDLETDTGDGNVSDVGAVTSAELILLALEAAAGVGTYSASADDELKIQGVATGTNGSVEILNTSTAGLLTELGLSAAVTPGTGNVPDSRRVTPAVLGGILGLAWSTGVTVVTNVVNGTILTTGTTGVGREHTLRWTGSARVPLGYPKLVRGAGVELDFGALRVIGARTAQPIASRGTPWFAFTPVLGATGDDIPTGVSRSLRRDADVNTIEHRSPTAVYAAYQDGRLCGRLSSGKATYIDQRYALDWLAEIFSRGYIRLLESEAEAGTSIGLTDADARPTIQGVASELLALAFAAGVIDSPDATPPDPDNGKITGVSIAFRSEIPTELEDLRHWPMTVIVRLSGKLQGLMVRILVGVA